MNVIHDNFIGIYENLYSEEYCQKVIDYFESIKMSGFIRSRQQIENINKTQKEDLMLFSHGEDEINIGNTINLQQEFNKTFWGVAYADYSSEYAVLKESDQHNSYAVKIQKTVPGGGYHVWHYESSARAESNRLLVWTLYLNNVEEGGETEFLYLHKRIKPKTGTLIIWPAAFTHTHRGNPPLSGNKYIATGWVEF